jgi:hypothetical protein
MIDSDKNILNCIANCALFCSLIGMPIEMCIVITFCQWIIDGQKISKLREASDVQCRFAAGDSSHTFRTFEAEKISCLPLSSPFQESSHFGWKIVMHQYDCQQAVLPEIYVNRSFFLRNEFTACNLDLELAEMNEWIWLRSNCCAKSIDGDDDDDFLQLRDGEQKSYLNVVLHRWNGDISMYRRLKWQKSAALF